MRFAPSDPRQALRFRRTLLGFSGYVLNYGVLVYIFWLGELAVTVPQLLFAIALSLLVNLAFFALIRSDLNKRWFPRDPSMTMLQVVVGLTWVLWVMFVAPDIRGVLSPIFITAFFFGIFRMQTWQYLVLAFYTLSVYGGMMAWDAWTGDWTAVDIQLAVLNWGVVSVVLVWFAWVGGIVAHLRRRLAGYARDLEEARDRLSELAIRDELTGLYNRRHIVEALEREYQRAVRAGSSFSIVMVDLDHFKRVNDTHGHLAGDDLLTEFSERVRNTIRTIDWAGRNEHEVGRFGGEEFILILPETGCEGAVRCAERIRETVSETPFDTRAGKITVTLSAGVACFRKDESYEDTLNRADQRLYAAKAAGRNRVVAEG